MLQVLIQILILGSFLVIYPPLTEFFELPKVVVLVTLVPIMYVFYSVSITLKRSENRGISQLYSRAPILVSLLFLFVFAAAFSSVLAGTKTSFWGQPYRYQGIIFFLMLSGLSYLISKYQELGISLDAVKRAIVWGAGIHVGLILMQGLAYIMGMSVYTFEGRMTGLVGNPNFAGGALALSYPYLFYRWQNNKLGLFMATLGGLIGVVLTDSRGGLIGFILALLLIWARKLRTSILVISAVLLTLGGAYFFPDRPLSSFDSRVTIWQKGWQAFQKKPFFGWGVENFSTAFQAQLEPSGDHDLKNIRVDKAHNEFLEMFVATGVVGGGIYLVIVLWTLGILWKHRADEGIYAYLVSAVVFVTLAQVNVLNVTEYIFFYLAVGVAISLDKDRYST